MVLLISVLCSLMIMIREADVAPSFSRPYQYVEPLPGLIPVYIRPGNTPLRDINPDLAKAFEIYEQKHGRFDYGRSTKNQEIHKIDIAEVKLPEEDNDIVPPTKRKETVINLNELSLGVPVAIALPDEPKFIHIQKIPRKNL
ncbi:uncharacterized protein LOC123321387 [Coccinella septempunctata]|uniref:uncharacterized protein LOC123321387 n=1 Tax=Coccinella septempunctata TaxID=41139 RepID=UPI001D067EC1|nr:uncharacterized protein LOC123321387 [Coccinella septempunctata]